MGDGGKGSSPRPFSVDQTTFADNWDRIFGKNKKEQDSADKYLCSCYNSNMNQSLTVCPVCGKRKSSSTGSEQ